MSEGLLEAMYEALRSTHGKVVTIVEGDFAQARAKAYALRKESCDPALDVLQFSQSPTAENEMWIVKKDKPQND